MTEVRVGIIGIQEAQAAMLRLINAVDPREIGGLGRAVLYGAAELHRYATYITHVVTGSLRASHRIGWDGQRGEWARARLYIDPRSVNPVTGERPASYGLTEHARGGSHAFYQRTYDEEGEAALGRAGAYLRSLL